MSWEVVTGDCLEVLKGYPDACFDAVCTDPPAGINFMNAKFDSDRGGRDNWIAWMAEIMAEALRVTKPGGHAFVWALPKTSHWTATALEDAGWEIREICHHVFGSGFPKSLDVSKAIDKMAGRIGENTKVLKQKLRARFDLIGLTLKEFNEACGFEASGYLRTSSTWASVFPGSEKWEVIKEVLGCGDALDDVFVAAEREVVGKAKWNNSVNHFVPGEDHTQRVHLDVTVPAAEEAKRWSGWGTALKPAVENWILCRKPLSESSVARQVLSNGCGALNIDASRIRTNDALSQGASDLGYQGVKEPVKTEQHNDGRWPSNLLMSHHESCVRVGTKRVKGTGWRDEHDATRKNPIAMNCANDGSLKDCKTEKRHYNGPDGTEEVSDWQCVEGCPVRIMDEQSGHKPPSYRKSRTTDPQGATWGLDRQDGREFGHHDSGGASRFFKCFGGEEGGDARPPRDSSSPARASHREYPASGDKSGEVYQAFEPDAGPGFFYCAKSSRRERNEGLEGHPKKYLATMNDGVGQRHHNPEEPNAWSHNHHPTVKPLALMRYLVKMVTPPGGKVLDPFGGSGTTGVACVLENFDCVLIEAEEDYAEIARRRIEHHASEAEERLFA